MKDRKAVIFGASGTLGRAVAAKLSESGWRLALASRAEAELRDYAAALQADVYRVDASDPKAVDDLVQELGQDETLAAAINCAGSVYLKPLHLTSPSDFADVMAANLVSSYAVARSASRALFKSGGSIVLTSSAVASIGIANHGAIAAAKAGVEGLVRATAATYAPRGIRVNAVAPGLFASKSTARIVDNPILLEQSSKMHALGRIGQAEEIAGVIGWLADESKSGWMTGQVVRIDGGLSTVVAR
jgi:NAD(P)-dependent dehydrogenase (short-subunit alcohol dehydrogenase family)